ncbi:6518_t:CDS:2, partial [Racocetra persica]
WEIEKDWELSKRKGLERVIPEGKELFGVNTKGKSLNNLGVGLAPKFHWSDNDADIEILTNSSTDLPHPSQTIVTPSLLSKKPLQLNENYPKAKRSQVQEIFITQPLEGELDLKDFTCLTHYIGGSKKGVEVYISPRVDNTKLTFNNLSEHAEIIENS